VDGNSPLLPADKAVMDPEPPHEEPVGVAAEEAGIFLNDDGKLNDVHSLMEDFDFDKNDGNWGIDIYCCTVILLSLVMTN
jgi:hypothetical protein